MQFPILTNPTVQRGPNKLGCDMYVDCTLLIMT